MLEEERKTNPEIKMDVRIGCEITGLAGEECWEKYNITDDRCGMSDVCIGMNLRPRALYFIPFNF